MKFEGHIRKLVATALFATTPSIDAKTPNVISKDCTHAFFATDQLRRYDPIPTPNELITSLGDQAYFVVRNFCEPPDSNSTSGTDPGIQPCPQPKPATKQSNELGSVSA